MSGRGEPRGGAGGGRAGVAEVAAGGTRRIPAPGHGNGRRDPEGSGGSAGSCRSRTSHPSLQVRYRPLRHVPNRAREVPWGAPRPLRPRVPGLAEWAPCPVALPQRWHPGARSLLGVPAVPPGSDGAAGSPVTARRGRLGRPVAPSQPAREVPRSIPVPCGPTRGCAAPGGAGALSPLGAGASRCAAGGRCWGGSAPQFGGLGVIPAPVTGSLGG